MPTLNAKSKTLKPKRGFTLIELLVIIALIGILSAVGLASFTLAQKKGRDSTRKADLDTMRKTLELAKSDTVGGFYPNCDTYVTIDSITNSCAIGNTNTTPDLSTAYIKTVPADPSGGSASYVYTPTPAACAALACTGYSLRTCLENSNDSQKDGTDSCTSTSTVSYTITNP